MYNNSKAQVGEVLKKGDSVWSYNTLVQDAYSPKWLIDFDPVQLPHPARFYQPEVSISLECSTARRQVAIQCLG